MGSIPRDLIVRAACHVVYNLAVGRTDIDGNTWADIFAKAVDGKHLGAPLGLADIVRDNCAWSGKTVKNSDPYRAKSVRLIVGRNSPEHSFGIPNPFSDIRATGRAVLAIWNARVDIAAGEHEDLRMIVLIRDMNRLRFSLFETEIGRFVADDYEWEKNRNGNLIGRNKADGVQEFTWQPHGSQLTILRRVPGSAIRFSVRRPPMLDFDEIMRRVKFDDSWVNFE